jgi:hypothetical protein
VEFLPCHSFKLYLSICCVRIRDLIAGSWITILHLFNFISEKDAEKVQCTSKRSSTSAWCTASLTVHEEEIRLLCMVCLNQLPVASQHPEGITSCQEQEKKHPNCTTAGEHGAKPPSEAGLAKGRHRWRKAQG